MEKILVGLIVGAVLVSTFTILKSKYFLGWQKFILGILIVFPPAQWILAVVFYLSNNFVDNNPKIKDKAYSTANTIVKNFQPVEVKEPHNRQDSASQTLYSGGHNSQTQPQQPIKTQTAPEAEIVSKKTNDGFSGDNPYKKN